MTKLRIIVRVPKREVREPNKVVESFCSIDPDRHADSGTLNSETKKFVSTMLRYELGGFRPRYDLCPWRDCEIL